jgi:hypothetical protein
MRLRRHRSETGHTPSLGEVAPALVGTPNREAIAWYVEQAQRLLEDQQRRAESLRTRGGQIAGFGAAVLALIGANAVKMLESVHGRPHTYVGIALIGAALGLAASVAVAVIGAIRPKTSAAISADEIANYTSNRFLTEPDLWRVHVRTLRALKQATTDIQAAGNSAAEAINLSLYFFLAGLVFSLAAIGMLVVELI